MPETVDLTLFPPKLLITNLVLAILSGDEEKEERVRLFAEIERRMTMLDRMAEVLRVGREQLYRECNRLENPGREHLNEWFNLSEQLLIELNKLT